MSDEVCVVVGATGALGRTIVDRLTGRGCSVLAVARDAERLEALCSESDRVKPCVADIGSDDAVDIINAQLRGQVRMAVFAAGLPVRGSADAIAPSALSRAADIKVGGSLRLLHAVRDHLVRDSRFVVIAGSLGVEPGPLNAGPGVANAGLLNLMRQISGLYGPRGVTTHTIAPGPIDTPRLRALVRAQAEESGDDVADVWATYAAEPSSGMLPTRDEIAWLVSTLLEPEARVLHGGVLTADGGTRRGVL